MPAVIYKSSKFARHWGPALIGSHSLSVSWNELVWAAMTVGKPGVAFLFGHGWHSVSDLIVRAHMVYANLLQARGYYKKSGLYTALDPTEKSGVSYFMGMIAARIVGYRLLGVPWLFHLSMINSLGGTAVLKSDAQPDLVGLRKNGDWVVVEAKGRTAGYSASAMSAAKSQTRQLRRVNGSYPSLRVAVQGFFKPQFQWALADPEQFEQDAADVNFDEEEALQMYYSAPMAAIQDDAEEQQIVGRGFLARSIDEIGVTIAIDRDLRERIDQRSVKGYKDPTASQDTASSVAHEGFAVFPDGLAIALDTRWSKERMERNPGFRYK